MRQDGQIGLKRQSVVREHRKGKGAIGEIRILYDWEVARKNCGKAGHVHTSNNTDSN